MNSIENDLSVKQQVQNQNEFENLILKNDSFLTEKFYLRFWQNLTHISVILHEQ